MVVFWLTFCLAFVLVLGPLWIAFNLLADGNLLDRKTSGKLLFVSAAAGALGLVIGVAGYRSRQEHLRYEEVLRQGRENNAEDSAKL
jgi:hypothetical protein